MSLFKARTRDRSFLFSVILTTAKMLFVTLLILAVAGTGVLMGIAKAWVETAPQLDMSVFGSQAKTSFVYDKYGELITDFKGNENRIDATWNEIPDNLKKAVIAIEDQRFHTHNGVDIRRISAFIGNLFGNICRAAPPSPANCETHHAVLEQTFRQTSGSLSGPGTGKGHGQEDILLQYMNLFTRAAPATVRWQPGLLRQGTPDLSLRVRRLANIIATPTGTIHGTITAPFAGDH